MPNHTKIPVIALLLLGCANGKISLFDSSGDSSSPDTGERDSGASSSESPWLFDLTETTYGYDETIPGTEALEADCADCQKCFRLENNALIVGVLHTDPEMFWEYDYHTYNVEDSGVYTVDFSYRWTSVASSNEDDDALAFVTVESTYDFETAKHLTIYDCPSEGMSP